MQVCYNGDFFPAHQPVITAQNPGFKWGEGLFETARVWRGELLSAHLHFRRLFSGMALLQLKVKERWFEQIIRRNIERLCVLNNCSQSARVRLAVFRDGSEAVGYLLEAIPLDEDVFQWRAEGIRLVLYPHVRKPIDAFANIKSASYLPYRMAAMFAADAKAGDALILNAAGALCDSSKANLFLVKDGKVSTPALHQGCVAGTMRLRVIEAARSMGYAVEEGIMQETDLSAADEVFLTNAIQTMRWVSDYQQQTYANVHAKRIFDVVSLGIVS